MDKKSINVYTDGGSRGNPGPAATGVVIIFEDGKKTHHKEYIGIATNNVAEYKAVISALKILLKIVKAGETAVFHIDSLLVVQQLRGVYKIKTPHIRALVLETKQLESELAGKVEYLNIPREKNTEADALVNEALDERLI